jgi:hypothetical protein|tara:strand:+ start:15956 stop:16969 length:1014 start_codon:yes stop_codon:yes gene_type:complete
MGDFDQRYVSIEKESTYGTDPSSSPVFGEIDDESFKHIYETMVREDMSKYGASKVVRGKEYCEGSLNTVMMTDPFTATMIAGLFATDTVTTGTPNVHLLEEGNLTTDFYPTFSIHIGRTARDHIFTGMSVNKMSVSASVGDFTTMSFECQGKSETTSQATMLTPTFPDNEPCYYANAEIFFNGNATKSADVKSSDFEISINRDLDSGFSIGNLTLTQAPPVTRRSISGTIEFNNPMYAATADEPFYDALTQVGGVSGTTFIYDSTVVGTPALRMKYIETTNADITFDFFKVVFDAPETSVSGREHQTMTTPFFALFDNTNDCMVSCTIRSATAGAYI